MTEAEGMSAEPGDAVPVALPDARPAEAPAMGGSFPPPAPMHLARVAAVPAAAPRTENAWSVTTLSHSDRSPAGGAWRRK